ncbi:Kelch-like protein 3 [Durusdinium trenchii]|uniref:Kelch-like protein 3 n=1 Tax=Durusdinium trenchii TaxID=1381693 RepID=A0ABP0H7A7_9DINO
MATTGGGYASSHVTFCDGYSMHQLTQQLGEREIVKKNPEKSDRITFRGSPCDAFQKGKMAVVSFPGVHGCGWNELTRVSCKHGSKLVTSCVFLPDGNAPGYGEHVPYKKGCHCHHLYGSPQIWGCAWYKEWMEQTRAAHRAGCELVVVRQMDGSLGTSQQGEVRFLDSENMPYSEMKIDEFAAEVVNKPVEVGHRESTNTRPPRRRISTCFGRMAYSNDLLRCPSETRPHLLRPHSIE